MKPQISFVLKSNCTMMVKIDLTPDCSVFVVFSFMTLNLHFCLYLMTFNY